MDFILTPVEVRVLGCLIEKEVTTPDYYPLSVNALQNACNQITNRNPVVSYDEQQIMAALTLLKGKGLVSPTFVGRVPKYEERLLKRLNLVMRETAVLCVLMLRGPQTVGEIRGRAERLHPFERLEEVDQTLAALTERSHVTSLPRQPSRKEARYAHLFAGPPDPNEEEPLVHSDMGEKERLAHLEAVVDALRHDVDALKAIITDFKAQFE